MKITIDTQVDTYEDIKKVLHILTGIIDKKEGGEIQINQSSTSVDTSSMMSMFADDTSKVEEKNSTAPDFRPFLNLVDQKEEKKEF